MNRQLTRWGAVIGAASVLAVLAFVANIATLAELEGRADQWLTARQFISQIVNSGTAWAGLLVLAGWLVGGRLRAAFAGAIAGVIALAAHYGLGELLGRLFEVAPAGFAENQLWFAAAVIFGPALGIVGAFAREDDVLGRLAGLVVPLGALAEPFVRGSFWMPDFLPWTTRTPAMLSGIVLVLFGLALAYRVLARSQHFERPVPVLPGAA